MATINLYCPQCGQIDSVRKVSAIVNSGTTSSSFSGYGDSIGYSRNGMVFTDEFITLTGSSQTHLSQFLSPPIQPQVNYFDDYTLIIVLSGIIGLITVIIGLFQILVSQFVSGTFILLFGLSSLGVCVWVGVSHSDLNKNNEIRFKQEHWAWQKALSKWQKLYYCYRCDGVFLPNLNHIIPSQHAYDYLYEEEEEELSNMDFIKE